MSDSVIIVAGGTGSRFGGDVPKQFLTLSGLPVLMQTLRVFYDHDPSLELIVVLPEKEFERWIDLRHQYDFQISHTVVAGGAERFYSVKNGLGAMRPGGVVGIHDAVRPLVSQATIKSCFDTARKLGNAIPATDAVDSLRQITLNGNIHVDRSQFRVIQTPQCFEKELILKAFDTGYRPTFTDDASVLEHAGYSVNLVPGNRENIKITSPIDLAIAETLFSLK